MQLEHSFTVPVGIEKAWAVLLDIETVAPCMPGAILDSVDGDSFTGRVKIKLGPISMTYKGKASFVEKDDATHKAVIDAQGKDSRGNGTAAATVTATLVEQGPDSTEVRVLTDLNITGKPAQFGRGVMVDVGNKLIGQFATCLEGKLSGTEEAAAPEPAAAEPATTPVAVSTDVASPTPDVPETPTPADMPAHTPAPAPAPRPAPARQPEPEPIDLLELAGGSVLTKAVPAAVGAVLFGLLCFLLGRRSR
ncbi:MAG: SRPBCC family protein [Geodermatophilaceae bacterium]|nr:SRPBCC family protein [Geodermatophilaceae bacterium]